MNLFDQLAETGVWEYEKRRALLEAARDAFPDYIKALIRSANRDVAVRGSRTSIYFETRESDWQAYDRAQTARASATAAGWLLQAGFTGDLAEDVAYLRAKLLEDRPRYARAWGALYQTSPSLYHRDVEDWGRARGLFLTSRADLIPSQRVPSAERQAKLQASRNAAEEKRRLARGTKIVIERACINAADPLRFHGMSQRVGAPPRDMLKILAQPQRAREILKKIEAAAMERCGEDKALRASVKQVFAAARKKEKA